MEEKKLVDDKKLNDIEDQPLSTFTKFETKFVKQSGRSKVAKILISSCIAVLVISGLYFTLTSLGELNDNIAGVFEGGEESKTTEVRKGPMQAAEGEEETPNLVE